MYGRAIQSKRRLNKRNESQTSEKSVFDHDEQKVFPKFEIKVNDIKRVAICDFGLSTKSSQKIPRGCTPTFMNPLAYTDEFEISKDRFSLAVFTLFLLWGDEYVLAYVPIRQRENVDEFRKKLSDRDDIYVTLFQLLHEAENKSVDIDLIVSRFPMKGNLKRTDDLLKSLRDLVRKELKTDFMSRFPNHTLDDKKIDDLISEKLQM